MQKIAYGLGFPASGINDYYKDIMAIRERGDSVKKLKGGYHRAMARAAVRDDEGEYNRIWIEMIDEGLQPNHAAIKFHTRDYLTVKAQGLEGY